MATAYLAHDPRHERRRDCGLAERAHNRYN
jgi:hypothetical protein